jgi:hypothetical protein
VHDQIGKVAEYNQQILFQGDNRLHFVGKKKLREEKKEYLSIIFLKSSGLFAWTWPNRKATPAEFE